MDLLYNLAFLFIGWLTFPILIFLRSRKSTGIDDSNILNIYRVIAHLFIHADDFLKMQYKDGKKPFHYLSKDEFSDIVDTRPNVE